MSYWLPASAVIAVVLVIGVIVWRNRRRALAAGRIPSVEAAVEAGGATSAALPGVSREARERAGLSVGERDRLRDELEAFDA